MLKAMYGAARLGALLAGLLYVYYTGMQDHAMSAELVFAALPSTENPYTIGLLHDVGLMAAVGTISGLYIRFLVDDLPTEFPDVVQKITALSIIGGGFVGLLAEVVLLVGMGKTSGLAGFIPTAETAIGAHTAKFLALFLAPQVAVAGLGMAVYVAYKTVHKTVFPDQYTRI